MKTKKQILDYLVDCKKAIQELEELQDNLQICKYEGIVEGLEFVLDGDNVDEKNTTEQKPESKLRLSNSQFIALSCELAHERVKEGHWKYGDGDSNRDYITEKDGEGCYTKSGQVYFDSLYDHYQDILNKYIDGQEPE
tara:strand:+ start:189 stop:602 length:414 start_codon:yes stop_codon:yes gene_type:complete